MLQTALGTIARRDEFARLCRAFSSDTSESGINQIIYQSSGGSSGPPLLVPRYKTDIADVFTRAAMPFVRRFGHLPKRIAMIGGASHLAAADELAFDGIEIAAMDKVDPGALNEFSPDGITCYPSILREILADDRIALPDLKAVKLGGERVFAADVRKAASRFEQLQIVEQYGSTEMPAVAFREHGASRSMPAYVFETKRFEVAMPTSDGWHRVLVADRFADLAVRLPGYYDTGDEALFVNGKAEEIRRAGDPANAYFSVAERLYSSGCVNLQFTLSSRRLVYTGDADLPDSVEAAGLHFQAVRVPAIARLEGSNKLPLLRP